MRSLEARARFVADADIRSWQLTTTHLPRWEWPESGEVAATGPTASFRRGAGDWSRPEAEQADKSYFPGSQPQVGTDALVECTQAIAIKSGRCRRVCSDCLCRGNRGDERRHRLPIAALDGSPDFEMRFVQAQFWSLWG